MGIGLFDPCVGVNCTARDACHLDGVCKVWLEKAGNRVVLHVTNNPF